MVSKVTVEQDKNTKPKPDKKKTNLEKIKRKENFEKQKKKPKSLNSVNEGVVSEILTLEKTIQQLDAEIQRVTDRLGEKSGREPKTTTDRSTETVARTTVITSPATTTTATEHDESTYYPMQHKLSSLGSDHNITAAASPGTVADKKIRIKLPLMEKKSKPKIQPYEFPLSEPLQEFLPPQGNGQNPEATTVIYAIPYVPEEEEASEVPSYRRF